MICEGCGFLFDDALGRYGCPDCNGETISMNTSPIPAEITARYEQFESLDELRGVLLLDDGPGCPTWLDQAARTLLNDAAKNWGTNWKKPALESLGLDYLFQANP